MESTQTMARFKSREVPISFAYAHAQNANLGRTHETRPIKLVCVRIREGERDKSRCTSVRVPRTRMLWSLALVIYTLVHFEANAQQTCDADTERPAVTLLTPPSGTTGLTSGDRGLSSIYYLQGERLDSISRMEIQFPPPQNIAPRTAEILQRNSTTVSFQIPLTYFRRITGGIPAIITIYPNNTACQNISLSMSIHQTGTVMIHTVVYIALPKNQ